MSSQMDLALGRRRQKMYLDHHEQAKDYLIEEIDRRLVARLDHGDRVIVDEAHVILEEILEFDVELGFPRAKIERRWLGAIFRRKHWVNTGDRKPTRRASRNASSVVVWMLDETKLEED